MRIKGNVGCGAERVWHGSLGLPMASSPVLFAWIFCDRLTFLMRKILFSTGVTFSRCIGGVFKWAWRKQGRRRNKKMKQRALVLMLGLLLAGGAFAAPLEKSLHLKLDVSMLQGALEKGLLSANKGNLHDGKLTVSNSNLNGLDLIAVLQAMQSSRENEFVTFQSGLNQLHVGRMGGNLIIRAANEKGVKQELEASIPFAVAQALFSAGKGELDLMGALQTMMLTGEAIKITLTSDSGSVQLLLDTQ
jgi:hypothetical protein